ncbi:MAG: SpoIIE family protein phosphatase [Terracidiphilus sp.]
MRRLVLLAVAALSLPACAQVFNMEQDRVQMSTLNGLMRFHTGDDPRWTEPGFDDSAWPLISSASDWSAQGYKDYGGYAWYRFKVILPPEHAQLGLYFPGIGTSYQVFANGQPVGSFGGFPPNATIYGRRRHLVLLPQSQAAELEIAIRVWHWPHWAMYYGGGISGAPRIGDAKQLKTWVTLLERSTYWQVSAQSYLALLNFLYGSAGFVLFLMRPKERLYLWYGLAGLFFCGSRLMPVFAALHDVPEMTSEAFTDGFAFAGFFCFLVFIWVIMRSRRTVWIWIGVAGLAAFGMMWTVPALFNLPVSVGNLILTIIRLPFTIIPVALLIQGVRRRDPDARLLMIPVGLNALANWINDGLWAMYTAGHAWAETYWNLWDKTFSWPFPIGLYDLTNCILLLAILGIVVLRFARSRHEQEEMQSEREAARAVQQVLIPDDIPAVPGFKIESVYKPAGEVGGDFFQIVPTTNGGVLIVVGDVSGKGMPAAMTVSLLVGTFRTLAHYTQSPGEILSAMNQRMLGRSQGGFTTCLVLRADANGKLTVANAGHIAPYVMGRELQLENGLPLGLAAESAYAETAAQLMPGEQLTLLTDGVVEARDKSGALMGFERVAAISTEPAEAIANAAQAFGQDDDITVLSVTRTASLNQALA